MESTEGVTTNVPARLSIRDEAKPFLLLGAVLQGILFNRVLGTGFSWLI